MLSSVLGARIRARLTLSTPAGGGGSPLPASVRAPPSADLPTAAQNNPDAKKLADRIRELEAKIPEPRRAPGMRDGTGRNEHVFIRGNHKTTGIEAPRAFLQAFGQSAFTGTGSGR